MNREGWWASIAAKPNGVCRACGGPAVPKNIGVICVSCIENVPDHIPNTQLEKYFKIKGEVMNA